MKLFCDNPSVELNREINENDREYLKFISTFVLKFNFGEVAKARKILDFFKLNKDGENIGTYNPHSLQWIFQSDNIQCQEVLRLPIKDRDETNIEEIYIMVRQRNVCAGRSYGYGFSGIHDSILTSGMQKYIRRNYVEKAIWCVLDRSFMRCDPQGGVAKLSHIRNRLKIIYLEDIGIANIDLFEYLWKKCDCISLHTDKEKKSKHLNYNVCESVEKTIVDVVSRMCQTKHTRMISYVKSITQLQDMIDNGPHRITQYLQYFPVMKNTLDYIRENRNKTNFVNFRETLSAKNIACFYYFTDILYPKDETNRRKMGKNLKGSNYMSIQKIIKVVMASMNMDLKYIKIADTWYRSFNNEETYYVYYHLMIMMCFPVVKMGYVDNFVEYVPKWKDIVMNCINNTITIDEYVMDMHTKVGNLLGYTKGTKEGKEHFIYDGGFVAEEYIPNKVAYELKSFYEFKTLFLSGIYEKTFLEGNVLKMEELRYNKRIQFTRQQPQHQIRSENDILNESTMFTFIGRPQVTTSVAKLDSYFAIINRDYKIFKQGDIVFVKGPLRQEDNNIYDILKFFRDMKMVLGLNYIDVEQLSLKMSDPETFFGETSNEGVKKSNIRYSGRVKPGEVYNFLIYENKCSSDGFILRKYGEGVPRGKEMSQAWRDTGTTIADFSDRGVCKVFTRDDLKQKEYLYHYVLSIYFRYLFGIVDHTDRNFLIILPENTLYSVDEENINFEKEITFLTDRNKEKNRELIKRYWSIISNDITSKLRSWSDKREEILNYANRIKPDMVDGRFNLNKFEERFNNIINTSLFM